MRQQDCIQDQTDVRSIPFILVILLFADCFSNTLWRGCSSNNMWWPGVRGPESEPTVTAAISHTEKNRDGFWACQATTTVCTPHKAENTVLSSPFQVGRMGAGVHSGIHVLVTLPCCLREIRQTKRFDELGLLSSWWCGETQRGPSLPQTQCLYDRVHLFNRCDWHRKGSNQESKQASVKWMVYNTSCANHFYDRFI